ncbi:MAG: hypothetical protein QOE51_521 [Actinoplanes sp.]|jgi:hypothetical protein|nr:hypothetical protein [Actinoplanes sp.]
MSRPRLIRILAAAATAVAACALVPPGPAAAVVTGHTGSGRPALAFAGGRLYLAWAGSSGTAAARELVVGYSTSGGLRVVKVPGAERTPRDEGPALSGDGTGVYLAWPAGDNGNTLTVAYTTGAALTCRTAFTGIVAAHAPALAADSTGLRYLAWIDQSAHLNVARLDSSACATTKTMTLTGRVTLSDTSVAGPALVYDDSGSSNLGFLLAYDTGDSARSISVGSFTGTPTLTRRSSVAGPAGSLTAPGLSSGNSDLYLSFTGTDGNVYLAFSEGCIPTCFAGHVSATGDVATGGVGLPSNDAGLYRSFFDPTGHLVVWHL